MRFIYLMLMIYIQVNYEHSVQTVPRGMNTPWIILTKNSFSLLWVLKPLETAWWTIKLRVSWNKIEISQWTEILLPKLTIYIIVDWTLGSPLSLISCLPRRIVAFPLFWTKPSLLMQKLTFLRATINLRLSFSSLSLSYSLKSQWINP